MAIYESRPRFEHCTRLCFSLMGERGFRISMGAFKDKTEVGNGLTFLTASRKDTSKKYPRKSLKNIPRSPATISGSAFTDELYAEMKLRKSNDEEITSLPLESYGFPYYRSYRNGGRSQDAVLVKDIGVSCTLLDEQISSHGSTKDSSVESYLVECLKTEYNDLSEITKKISAYTSDIIRNLILRDRKREEIRSRRTVTQREMDQGEPSLKMRLKNEVRCLYQKDAWKGIESSEVSIDERNNFSNGDTETNTTKSVPKDRKSLRKSISAKSCSSSDSSTIVYDYLMMGSSKTYRRTQRETVKLIDSETNRKFGRKLDKLQNDKENIESPERTTLTNWQEISRGKLRKNKSISKISRDMINEKLKRRDRGSHRPELVEKFSDGSMIKSINGFVRDTNFHTVNIRIVKHKKSDGKL